MNCEEALNKHKFKIYHLKYQQADSLLVAHKRTLFTFIHVNLLVKRLLKIKLLLKTQLATFHI